MATGNVEKGFFFTSVGGMVLIFKIKKKILIMTSAVQGERRKRLGLGDITNLVTTLHTDHGVKKPITTITKKPS